MMFPTVILLCLTFYINDAQEIIDPDTPIGITDPGVTFTEVLWILKDWRCFTFERADIYSPTFTSVTKQTSKFRFKLRWLIGNRPRTDTLRIRFYHAENSDLSEVTLRVKIDFLNMYHNQTITLETTDFHLGVMITIKDGYYIEWNWKKFTFNETLNLFTLFGTSFEPDMRILVKIYYIGDITETWENSIVEFNGGKQTFRDYGSALILDEDTADVLFSLPDGNRSLHSALVKLRSPETYNHYLSSVRIDKQSVNFTTNVSLGVFDQIMQFIYTDRLPSLETENEWKELLLGASRLKIKKLEDICIGKIYKKITLENALEWITFAKCNNYLSVENYVKKLWKFNAVLMTSKQWDAALNLCNHIYCPAV